MRVERRAWPCVCLRRVRDYAEVRADGSITANTADAALDLLEIDELGLDDLDRQVLAHYHRQIWRRARRSGHHRRLDQRRVRHDHGCGRALPACSLVFWNEPPAAAWPRRHAYRHLNIAPPPEDPGAARRSPAFLTRRGLTALFAGTLCLAVYPNDVAFLNSFDNGLTMIAFGRLLLIIGLAMALIGGILLVAGRYFPWLGNLPGDLHYESENVKIYISRWQP